MYNLTDDGKWKGTFFEKYEAYLPLAIQFFLGGLCSAYVIYFSRSVSYTKTIIFFILLLILLFANEVLKRRLSNKYLQFSAYFFVCFTFFTFFIPMIMKSMSTFLFLVSGFISLGITLALIIYIYSVSPSTRKEIHLGKMTALILGIYLLINTFYYFNIIPPVPLALDNGLIAHNVEKVSETDEYIVTYEKNSWYRFWRENKYEFAYQPGSDVYVFTSIFAPSKLKKAVLHRWKWYSPHTERWEIIDEIEFEITGGREGGFRGYTYKSKMMDGQWKVDVITDNGQVLGNINFEIDSSATAKPVGLIKKVF
ncbi:MAG: DUF2914 domain-containing protein [Gracilimonas sp.]